MGKGLIGLNPIHSDGFLVYNVGLSGIMAVLFAATDMKSIIMGTYNYILYYLVLAMYPRMMVTVNEDLENLQVSCRVGQAVDTVAQAGQPKAITGFQTHNTP